MDADDQADAMMEQLFQQARAQFGNAVKSFWFYDDDPCPGCGREVDTLKHKGQDALSLNAFIYRERGVLIGYVLCGRCAKQILKASERNPYKQIPLHDQIESNLVKAWRKHLH